MSDTSPDSLHVPAKAINEIARQLGQRRPQPGRPYRIYTIRVQQIAAPVVAAELRAIASEAMTGVDGLVIPARELYARADELDPDGATRELGDTTVTEPVETYDDGGALYQAGPIEVAAQPPGVNPGVVSIDGRIVTPHTARQLARVLEVAADRAQGGRTAESDREAPSALYLARRAQAKARDVRDGEIEIDGLIHTLDALAERLSAERPADLDPTYRTQES